MYQSSKPKKFPKWNSSNYCLAANNPAAISLCLPVQSWQRGRSSNGHCFMPLCKNTSLYSQGDSYPIFKVVHLHYPLCSFIVFFQVHLHWITVKVFAPQPSGISRIQLTAGACLYGFRHGTCQRGGIHGLMDNNCHTLGILCEGGTSKTHLLCISRLQLYYPDLSCKSWGF